MKGLTVFLALSLYSFFAAAVPYQLFYENGKAGLKDGQGKVVIPAQYDALGWSNGAFSMQGNVTGYSINKKWGIVTLENKRLTKEQYEELLPGEGNIVIAKKKTSYSPRLFSGCINFIGKEVVPFIYDGITISAMRAIVFTMIGNHYKYGLIDLENKTIIPQHFQDIRSLGTLRYAVRNFEGKTALFADDGKQMTSFDIDSISSFRKNYAIIYKTMYKGLIDRDGQVKAEPRYRDVDVTEDGKVRVRQADRWAFLDGHNNEIRAVHADQVASVHKNLLKIENNNVVQLTDVALAPVSQAYFSSLSDYNYGKAVYKLGNLYGVLSINGSVIVPAIYHSVEVGKDYIIANQKQGEQNSWILFDTLGVRKTQKVYETMNVVAPGIVRVSKRGYVGAVNFNGVEFIACTYDSLLQFAYNHVVVKFHGLYGIVSHKEEWRATPKPNKLKLVNEERYLEYSPTSTLLKSYTGNVIYFTQNKFIAHPDHLIEFLPSGNVWKIDMNGVIIDRQMKPQELTEEIYPESEGLRAIKRNGRYGFIDSRGRLRIANRYEEVGQFSEGLAAMKILGKWGFVNKQDNIAVQPSYDEVSSFKNGVALVKQKGSYGLIDNNGKLILPIRYQKIDLLPSGNLRITVNDLHGLADKSGNVFINPKYETLEDVGNGFVIVKRDSKYGIITAQGISTIPIMYDELKYDVYNNLFFARSKTEWTDMK